jgi:5-formyltetrahydrofolate cyclo-ligase
VTVGLAFDAQVVDRAPAEPHDRPVDVVATESDVFGG